ncbi:rod shape-determining protein MreC [Enterococcus sp. HY326]|uniref:rod shape-determining protein MreC n=1 Tax=Enterococcus sp. HY326 TaxID=2971265 RepID=UPI00223EE720|nr:rod shape-determining protein MreC [Enterococcus sp. HY326]
MKKFNPNKNIIIILIIVIVVVVVISVTAASRDEDSEASFPQSVVNDVVGFADSIVTAPVNWITDGVASLQDLFSTYEENQNLKSTLDSYESVVQQNSDYEQQIADLQQQLELTNTLSDYDTVNANVISRSPDAWQDNLVIDVGSNDGIAKNMAVMSQHGIVGRVVEVSDNTSKVELLTTDNETTNHYPVKITATGETAGISYGVLGSYDNEKNQLVISQVTGTADIAVGDLVQTSGLGGNSPANLVIGTVAEIVADSDGLTSQIYVTPSADLYNISVVTVVERAVGGE